MVVEYTGERVRPVVADVREEQYENRGLGTYFWRFGFFVGHCLGLCLCCVFRLCLCLVAVAVGGFVSLSAAGCVSGLYLFASFFSFFCISLPSSMVVLYTGRCSDAYVGLLVLRLDAQAGGLPGFGV